VRSTAISVSFASTTARSRALAARSAATASGADGTSGTSHHRPQPTLRSQPNTLAGSQKIFNARRRHLSSYPPGR
jgi:hypothetical protein